MAIFTGVGVAIVTPFNEDGSINFEEFGKIIEDQIAGHTDAIIVCGTTGESSTMDDDEHLATIKYCVEKVAGRIPVIAGTGSNCTRESINLSKKAEEIGVDGLLCVTPYYNKATQAGLYEYYKAISDAVNIPIIGMGGIMNAYDVLEFLYAGASAVMVGTANLIDPYASLNIVNELPHVLEEYGFSDIKDAIGYAHRKDK